MKALFAHDHRFIPLQDGRVLSEGQFPSSLWERYLHAFDSLTVVARRSELPQGKAIEALNVSSRQGVSFAYVPNLASPTAQVLRRRRAMVALENAVENVDAVISRLPSETGLLAVYAAERLGRPWAVEVEGCPWDGLWNYGTWQGKIYAPIMWWRTRQAVARAPFALYVTQRFLQRRYPCLEGFTTTCSCVEIDMPAESVMMQRLKRFQVPRERLVFGLIGTLHGRFKGIQTALAAFKEVRSQLPPFEFRVLGGGNKQPWEALARQMGVDDVVRFQGILPSGEPVLAWLDDVDIYLQPSLKEGLPRALIEAMSRGCPAIASMAAGIPELLTPEVLHEPGNVRGLAGLILHMTHSSDFQLEQAKRNFVAAKEYGREVLDPRRQAFWERFAEYVTRRGAAAKS